MDTMKVLQIPRPRSFELVLVPIPDLTTVVRLSNRCSNRQGMFIL